MPRSSSLRSVLDTLAQSFTSGVLAAIRSASIEDLLAESSGGRGRRAGGGGGGQPDPLRGARTTKSGRLARRSADQIARAVDQVVALVKRNKAGMRAEQIKNSLGLDVREMPRILRTGVATKKLKAKGQKRATVYTAR